MRHLLAIAVLTVAITGCDDSATYSTEEVVAAFQRQGYTLVPRLSFPGNATAPGESDVLTPRGGQPFTVSVLSDAVADEAWGDYESQQTHESFDVRRANVVVISDSGLAIRQRERVLAAMSALPDRGAAVVIAGRRATETAVSGPENGQEPRRRPGPTPKPALAERRCNRCKEVKAASGYARGRGTCRSCRRAQQREHDRRVALAEDEEPHPDDPGPSVVRWLLDRGLAEQRDGELVATDAGRELGGAIFG